MISLVSGLIPLDGLWHPIVSSGWFGLPPGWAFEIDGPMVRAVRDGFGD